MENFYVAIKPCGCLIAACVDDKEFRKENSQSIKEWIKKGYIVERRTREEFKLQSCKCKENK